MSKVNAKRLDDYGYIPGSPKERSKGILTLLQRAPGERTKVKGVEQPEDAIEHWLIEEFDGIKSDPDAPLIISMYSNMLDSQGIHADQVLRQYAQFLKELDRRFQELGWRPNDSGSTITLADFLVTATIAEKDRHLTSGLRGLEAVSPNMGQLIKVASGVSKPSDDEVRRELLSIIDAAWESTPDDAEALAQLGRLYAGTVSLSEARCVDGAKEMQGIQSQWAKEISRNTVWPSHDFKAMRDQGTPAALAAFVKYYRQNFPATSPVTTPAGIANYAYMLRKEGAIIEDLVAAEKAWAEAGGLTEKPTDSSQLFRELPWVSERLYLFDKLFAKKTGQLLADKELRSQLSKQTGLSAFYETESEYSLTEDNRLSYAVVDGDEKLRLGMAIAADASGHFSQILEPAVNALRNNQNSSFKSLFIDNYRYGVQRLPDEHKAFNRNTKNILSSGAVFHTAAAASSPLQPCLKAINQMLGSIQETKNYNPDWSVIGGKALARSEATSPGSTTAEPESQNSEKQAAAVNRIEREDVSQLSQSELLGIGQYPEDWVRSIDNFEVVAEQTGLRAIQTGNSMTDKEVAEAAPKIYFALHKFAEVTGIPLSQVGLGLSPEQDPQRGDEHYLPGDSLAISYGSRGRGGRNAASAHFEPLMHVINLTRNSGAGSLAHEMAHAMDYRLAELFDPPHYSGKRAAFFKKITNSKQPVPSYASEMVILDIYLGIQQGEYWRKNAKSQIYTLLASCLKNDYKHRDQSTGKTHIEPRVDAYLQALSGHLASVFARPADASQLQNDARQTLTKEIFTLLAGATLPQWCFSSEENPGSIEERLNGALSALKENGLSNSYMAEKGLPEDYSFKPEASEAVAKLMQAYAQVAAHFKPDAPMTTRALLIAEDQNLREAVERVQLDKLMHDPSSDGIKKLVDDLDALYEQMKTSHATLASIADSPEIKAAGLRGELNDSIILKPDDWSAAVANTLVTAARNLRFGSFVVGVTARGALDLIYRHISGIGDAVALSAEGAVEKVFKSQRQKNEELHPAMFSDCKEIKDLLLALCPDISDMKPEEALKHLEANAQALHGLLLSLKKNKDENPRWFNAFRKSTISSVLDALYGIKSDESKAAKTNLLATLKAADIHKNARYMDTQELIGVLDELTCLNDGRPGLVTRLEQASGQSIKDAAFLFSEELESAREKIKAESPDADTEVCLMRFLRLMQSASIEQFRQEQARDTELFNLSLSMMVHGHNKVRPSKFLERSLDRGGVRFDFSQDSMPLVAKIKKKNYWGSVREHYARAVESGLQDRLHEMGSPCPFLVNGTKASGAYPLDEERDAIAGSALETLIAGTQALELVNEKVLADRQKKRGLEAQHQTLPEAS